MDSNFEELAEYINKLEEFKLPEYSELPQIPLYMEQVVSYVNDSLDALNNGYSQYVTQFMVNNYVKAKIIASPTHKKYSRDHLGYLLSISLLKNVVSMRNLATIIDLDKKFTDDKQKLYTYFKGMQDEVIHNEAHRVKARMDVLFKGNKKNKNDKSDNDEELLNMCYIALRLYVESASTKLIADSIMDNISKIILPKKVFGDLKKERKFENKKIDIEANSLKKR
jgi:hypothetical protein